MPTSIGSEILKGLHTKQLLKALRKTCVSDDEVKQWNDVLPDASRRNKDELYARTLVSATCFGYDDYVESTITVAELKAELATREHVPNKIEAKAVRRAKAKAKRNR